MRAGAAVSAVSVGWCPQRSPLLALPEICGGRSLLKSAVRPSGPQDPKTSRPRGLAMLELPILRWGRPYRSVDRTVVPHFRTREPFVAMNQAKVGLIRRDLLGQAAARARLRTIPAATLVDAAHRAADAFMHDALPLDPESGTVQTPKDYVEQVTA